MIASSLMQIQLLKILWMTSLLSISLYATDISRTQIIMGTYITIELDVKDKKQIEQGFNIFRDVDSSLSTYNTKSTIFKLNKNKKVKQDNYSYEAMLLATHYYKKTDGYFDITIGSLTKDAYSFGDAPKVPSQELVDSSKVDFKGLVYSKEIAMLKDGIKLDFGGMGKGFGVDMVSEHYSSLGLKDVVISASGDIRCFGICTINIDDPFSEKPLLTFIAAKTNLGISTSGNYNRYIKETKHNHLINPKTKKPQTKFISITIISELPSSDLDAYATAVAVMPTKKAYEFLNALDLAYVVLQSNKKMIISNNFSEFAILNRSKKYP